MLSCFSLLLLLASPALAAPAPGPQLGLPAAPSAAPVPPYWESYETRFDIQKNGDFLVAEDQVVVFGPRTAQRGFREIPLDRADQITGVQVSEPGRQYRQGSSPDVPYTFRVQKTDQNTLRIDWYFPPTSNASRHFIVSYRVVGGIRYYSGGDQLYWMAIYADRPYPVDVARAIVTFPQDLTADQVKTASYPERLGAPGALVDPRTVRFEASNVPAGTGLEIRVQFPHGIVTGQPPSWQAAEDRVQWYNDNVRPLLDLFLGALAIFLLVVGVLWVFVTWLSHGRDPSVGEVPDKLSEPPSDLPPGVAGTLVDERADVQDVIATVVDLARRGVLRIVEENRPRGRRSGEDFRVELLNEDTSGLREYERTIVKAFFGGDRSVRFSKLGDRIPQ